MNPKIRSKQMVVPTLIMGGLSLTLLFIGYQRGNGEHITGLTAALRMLVQITPLLVFAFIVANMAQTLVPRESIAHWVGEESGLRGLIIASVAGGLAPGGPFVNLPLAAALLKAGASIGVTVAFLTGWSLLAVMRLPIEIGIMGWKFMVIRMVSVLIFPPIAGLIAQAIVSAVKA